MRNTISDVYRLQNDNTHEFCGAWIAPLKTKLILCARKYDRNHLTASVTFASNQ